MNRATVRVECPNGCFEINMSGPSREHLERTALKRDEPGPCPNCGATETREWSE